MAKSTKINQPEPGTIRIYLHDESGTREIRIEKPKYLIDLYLSLMHARSHCPSLYKTFPDIRMFDFKTLRELKVDMATFHKVNDGTLLILPTESPPRDFSEYPSDDEEETDILKDEKEEKEVEEYVPRVIKEKDNIVGTFHDVLYELAIGTTMTRLLLEHEQQFVILLDYFLFLENSYDSQLERVEEKDGFLSQHEIRAMKDELENWNSRAYLFLNCISEDIQEFKKTQSNESMAFRDEIYMLQSIFEWLINLFLPDMNLLKAYFEFLCEESLQNERKHKAAFRLPSWCSPLADLCRRLAISL